MRSASPAAGRLGSCLLAAGLVAMWHASALGQPGPLERHSAIYDSARQRMIVFGGVDANSQATNDCWELALSGAPQWRLLAPVGLLPPKRYWHLAVYDPAGDRMLVFGGQDSASTNLGDVWALALSDPPAWSQLQVPGPGPQARHSHTAIYDPARGRMVIYGGRDALSQPLGDAWILRLTPTPGWDSLSVGGPQPRYRHSAIYDAARDRMLIFSGSPSGTNDVWALSLGAPPPAWSYLQPAGTPPSARYGHSAIYDPEADRMVVFGGLDRQQLNETWELSLAGSTAWSPIPGSGDVPSRRLYHSAVLDSASHRMVVFGGAGDPDGGDPTWALSLAQGMTWSPDRPVLHVSTGSLRLPTVTVGDTVSVVFSISNSGLQPLQVGEFQLPTTDMSLSPVVPFSLAWRETVEETLLLAASTPDSSTGSLVIVSNDLRASPKRVSLGIDVRKLDFETRTLGDLPAPLGISRLVVATPKPEVRVERGTLYYRVAGSTSPFDSLALTSLATDFIAAIPASSVTERGVEYFVKLENSGFLATRPPGAPSVLDTLAVAPPASITAVPRPTSGSDFLAGRAIEVEVVLPAGTSFDSGEIHYRRGGEPDYQAGALALNAALGQPSATIPDSMVGPRGVEYWVEVRTFNSRLRYPVGEGTNATIRVRVQGLDEPSEHAGGRYRLLTVPLDFGSDFSGSLDDLLTDQLGTYDPVRWRAFSYVPDSLQNIEFSSGAVATFKPEPGRAFWLISRDAHRIDTRPIDGLSTPTGGEYVIVLRPGWNLFGNPFDFPVAWSDVRRDASATSDPVAFDPSLGRIGDYAGEAPAILVPFDGYFIHATQAETLWVAPRVVPPPVSPARLESRGDLWRFQLRAWTENAADGSNVFGLHPGAAEGFDPLDWPKPPPPPGAWVQAAFTHPEWGERAGPYRHDLRAPGAPGETWEVEVQSGTSGEPVTIEMTEVGSVPAALALRIVDREQDSWVDGRQYRIVPFGQRPYRLAIVAGTPEYVAQVTQKTLALPERVSLDPGEPNPFRSAARIRFGLPRAEIVTLEIYSVLGQRVAAPLERVPLAAGYHSVVWDGTAANGGRAASGVYLLRLTAGGKSLTRRIVLVR